MQWIDCGWINKIICYVMNKFKYVGRATWSSLERDCNKFI